MQALRQQLAVEQQACVTEDQAQAHASRLLALRQEEHQLVGRIVRQEQGS